MPAFRTALISSLMAILAFLSAGGYGYHFIQRSHKGTWTPLEEGLFASVTGYGILGLLMIAAGVLRAWTPVGAWILLAGGLALSRPFIRLLASWVPSRALQIDASILLIALCALWGYLLALAPVTYYDSLVYHFTMPAAYARAHHWLGMKELIYPAFPQNLEMLWTLGLLLGGDQVANLMSLTLTLLTVAGTGAFAAHYLSRHESRVAILLLAAMPAMLLLSSGGYVDNGLTLYAFFSFYALRLWQEEKRLPLLLLSGCLAGVAVGVKWTGAIPLSAGGVLLAWSDRRRPAVAVKHLLVYGGAAMLTLSPWLIKNMHYVGNPFFPFFYQWGNPKLSPWVQEAAAGYFRGLAEYVPRSSAGFLLLPWDIAVRSLRFGGGMDILGDYGWAPFVFLVPCLVFCRKPWPPVVRALLAYAAMFSIPWACTRPVLRFLLPLAPVLSLLAAAAWTRGVLQWPRWLRGLAQGTVVGLLLVGFGFFFVVESIIEPFPSALGLESRDHYLSRKLNYYAAARFVNQLPEGSRVFVLGDQRGYYYSRPVLVTPVFNQNPLVAWADGASSPRDLAARLKEQGITHLLVNNSELERLERSYNILSFTSSGRRNWDQLRSALTRPLYHDAHCDILALK